ncbi:MAG: hypothetical protein ACRDP7_07780 [Trebonia sp.]
MSTLSAGGDDAPTAADVLGVFGIPLAEITAAERMGAPAAVLAGFFPQASGQTVLSRSALYYEPARALPAGQGLWLALRAADRDPGAVPALRRALAENLLNLYAAAAFAEWEAVTRQALDGPAPCEQALDALLGAATRLAGSLAGIPARLDDDPPASLPVCAAGPLRSSRELDSQAKIRDELAYLLACAAGEGSGVTAVALPMYGSMALGLAARAVLPAARPGLSVHLIRLGFHDLAGAGFLATDGTVRTALTAPPGHRERLAAAAAAGGRVLVIDDNVGYGTTLRAARRLIAQHGGTAVTRAAETAWHLYRRSGSHDIADAADLPSLRPNLHHSVQARLAGHLLRGNSAAYAGDPARRVRHSIGEQMTFAYQLALATGTWTPAQLAAMRRERAFAVACWDEPGVPPPPDRASRA